MKTLMGEAALFSEPKTQTKATCMTALTGGKLMRFQHKLPARTCLKRIWIFSACTLGIACALAVPAEANSIPIAYSFAGASLAPPVQSGTTLIIDNFATGSILSGDPALNAIWNPVTFQNHCVVDLTTGLLHGTITFVFADGATLFGNEFEDVSAVVATGGTGPFTEIYTFTGGTGEFAGATGSVSGGGIGVATGFTESGSGTLNAPAVPEPASAALFLGGLALLIGGWWRPTAKSASELRQS